LESFDGQHSTVGRVSIIGSSSSVKLAILNDRNAGPKSFVPTCEWWLLIVVAVEENGFIEIAFDFGEDDGTEFLDFDDLRFGTFDFELFDPFFDVLGGFFEEAIGLPIRIKVSRKVGYFDVLHQRGDVGFVEHFFDVFLTGLNVKFFGFHSAVKESGIMWNFFNKFMIWPAYESKFC
jgi:hypothetical protein